MGGDDKGLDEVPLCHAIGSFPQADLGCGNPAWGMRCAGKFGTKKYWSTSGEDTAIVNSVAAIDSCLREPVGVGQCANIRGVME